MKSILTAKHWQIFLVLFLGTALFNFGIEGYPVLSLTLRLSGILILYGWLIFLGHYLWLNLPAKIDVNYNLFIINAFLILIVICFCIIFLADGETLKIYGLLALSLFYVIYAAINIYLFPAKVLVSIELGRKAIFKEYIGDAFLIMFSLVGIWTLQPRINRLVKKSENNHE